jgi:hypothetical protein
MRICKICNCEIETDRDGYEWGRKKIIFWRRHKCKIHKKEVRA